MPMQQDVANFLARCRCPCCADVDEKRASIGIRKKLFFYSKIIGRYHFTVYWDQKKIFIGSWIHLNFNGQQN